MENLIKAICSGFLHSLWQGLALTLLAALLMVLTRKLSPALRYNLLCTCFLVFIGSFVYTVYTQYLFFQTREQPVPGAGGNLFFSMAEARSTSLLYRITEWSIGHSFIIMSAWLVFFMVRIQLMLHSLLQVVQLKHRDTSRLPAEWETKFQSLSAALQIRSRIIFRQSARVTQPIVIGILKPVVLIPLGMLNQLSAAEVEAVLLHELAHIRRRDFLVNLLQSLCESVFFFNPGFIWLSNMIRKEREHCCDAIAVEKTGSRKTFISALLAFHESGPAAEAYVMGFGLNQNLLSRRVDRIIQPTKTFNTMSKIIFSLCGVLAFMLLFSFSSIADTESKKEKQSITAKFPAPSLKSKTERSIPQITVNKKPVTKVVKAPIQHQAGTSRVTDTIPFGASKEFIDGYNAGMRFKNGFVDDKSHGERKELERGLTPRETPAAGDKRVFSTQFNASQKKQVELEAKKTRERD